MSIEHIAAVPAVGMLRRFVPVRENGVIYSHLSLWFPWVKNRQLHCANVCEYAFPFSAQIYLLKEKHICIKKP